MSKSARDKIRELRALHDEGLLTQDEFDKRKNAILDAQLAPSTAAGGAGPLHIKYSTDLGLMPGQEIGPQNKRYRLDRLLGQGGMGQVWAAQDLATHAELGHSELVALKILPPQLTQSASHAKLLIEEATQARRLAHENIVRVYEWAQDPATSSYFIIMEFLDGMDLDRHLAEAGPFSPEQACQLLQPVAQALRYAWDKHQLVHRDIKPGNLFLTHGGETKLLDFGIAARVRITGSALGMQAPGNAGTVGYRAPEAVARQRQPSPRLDVYALAVMFYQLIEGELPFGDTRDPSHLPSVPEALNPAQWKVLQRGFAYQHEERHDSAVEFLESLRGAAGPSKQQIEEQKRRQAAAAAAAIVSQQAELQRQQQAQALQERQQAEAARLLEEQRRASLLRPKVTADSRLLDEQDKQRRAIPGKVFRDKLWLGGGEGPEMAVIPRGRFLMGSPEEERHKAMVAGAQKDWLNRETPQHWVELSQPFAIGIRPVTRGQWRKFVEATGWKDEAETNWNTPGYVQDDDHPVVCVSWQDAQEYIEWLRHITARNYRLPSEAEWEYACRAGTSTAFSFGDTITTGNANYDGNFSYNGSPKGECREGTTRVGTYKPNPWGLFDMHGNVWEWVQDVVHDNYKGAPSDGGVWAEGGDQGRRVLRGGSWLYNPRYLRSALRNGYVVSGKNDIVGFRLARTLG